MLSEIAAGEKRFSLPDTPTRRTGRQKLRLGFVFCNLGKSQPDTV